MPEGQHLSGPMAVLCIVNGMIGGLILILPVMALEAGWLLTLVVIVATGLVSYYSCYLCLYHTGDQPDLDTAILQHFGGKRSLQVFYEVCILATLLLILFLYYELIVLQWIGLAPPHQYTPLNPLANMVALLVLTLVIKFKEIGATLMAYGIVSIAAYLLFVTWVVGSQQEDSQDGRSLSPFGGSGMDLAAALAQAFAIQFFFIPVLKKNRKQHKHKFYLLIAFVLGALAYAYIAFMGSYGILHRTYLETDGRTDRTIEGFFEQGTWEVNAIEVIYLVHLYSVYPEYLLIGKKRFFSIFGLQESQVGDLNRSQLIFMVSVLGLCLVIALLRVSLRQIIEFNGAVLGFFFIYFFPVAIHFKCCFMKSSRPGEQPGNVQESPQNMHYLEMIEEPKNTPLPVTQSEKQFGQGVVSVEKEAAVDSNARETVMDPVAGSSCEGEGRLVSKGRRGCELCVMAFMLVAGLTIMVQGVVEILKGDV